LNDALVRAEDRSDVMIRNVFLGVSGAHIESLNNIGRYRLPEDQTEITEDDVEEAKEIARNVNVPQQNVFLHSMTRQYIVDGQEAVRQPIGREARFLEADYHIIHGVRGRIQNAIRCVREIPLEVEDVVFNPIAAAQVVLSREAKNQGALIIKFGAEWCGPCKKIDPLVYKWMGQPKPNMTYAIIDIDDNFEIYAFLKSKKMVNGVPVILCYKKGNLTWIPDHTVIGADESQINIFFQICSQYS
jgi:thiol-disulfide isomerase/thioredoxin